MRTGLALLTILPTGRRALPAPGPAGLLAFPVVGVLVGLLWAAAGAAGLTWWGPLVGAAAVIVGDAIVTGGLHLDGVADIGDVVGSRRRGPAALEVARDARVGALGVVTVAAVLLLRLALLATALSQEGAWTLVAVPVVGRVAMLQALRRCAPDEHSLARPLADATTVPVLAAALVGAITALALTGLSATTVAVAVGAVVALIEVATWWWRRRIGPGSGDLVGAAGVGAELVALLALTGSWTT